MFRFHASPQTWMDNEEDRCSGDSDNRDITLLHPEMFSIRALEGITTVGEERGMKNVELEEAVAKAVEELKKSNVKSVWAVEWLEADVLLLFRGKVYVLPDPELCRRIIFQHHDSRIGGHAEQWKTLELVAHSYWWPKMSRYISQYVKTCDLCLHTKIQWRA
ncbi:hypothetical protein M422DRAFT_271337 [Sphaerobolus stellatus SS14]|uniref:Integrase zinc-binding domain-containing protein n=1 Tax=Sphaerobolus stellatus (strain SS14) TaxID=990650 RepID=A0A0C9U0H7_SPHS4|nr:hypothetical protein M422DRAFT_271337 [Sphaerobolus stellatus SS14]